MVFIRFKMMENTRKVFRWSFLAMPSSKNYRFNRREKKFIKNFKIALAHHHVDEFHQMKRFHNQSHSGFNLSYHKVLSHVFSIFFQNCVGWLSPVFWSYRGFKCILGLFETIFGIGRKNWISWGQNLDFKFFFLEWFTPYHMTHSI